MMKKNKNMNNNIIPIVTLITIITVIFLQFPIIQSAEAENTVNVTLYANNYGYNSTKGGPEIKAIVGDKIIINIIGNGTGPVRHNFVLDKDSPSPYEVSSDRLRNGEKDEIIFIANKSGRVQYYCSISPPYGDSHRDKGQQGIISIEEKEGSIDKSYDKKVTSRETEKPKNEPQVGSYEHQKKMVKTIEEIIGANTQRAQFIAGAIFFIAIIIVAQRSRTKSAS